MTTDPPDTFQTAARYHMFHALALLAVAYAAGRFGGGPVTAAGWVFLAGTLFFSGVKLLAAVAPVGGVCLLAGWVCLAVAAWRT